MPFGVSSLEDSFKHSFRDNWSLQEPVDLSVKRPPGIQCWRCPGWECAHYACGSGEAILRVLVEERRQVQCGSNVWGHRCSASWKWLSHWMPHSSSHFPRWGIMKLISGCLLRDCRGDCRGAKGSIGRWSHAIHWPHVASLGTLYLTVRRSEYANIIYKLLTITRNRLAYH